MSDAHHVVMRFRLPPALLLRAPVGLWERSPRGVIVAVASDGAVTVTGIDHSETFAEQQVLRTAAKFLRAIDARTCPVGFAATLSAPSCRRRPRGYAISFGAKVSIARSDFAPTLAADAPVEVDAA
jgi:hypothetical protein